MPVDTNFIWCQLLSCTIFWTKKDSTGIWTEHFTLCSWVQLYLSKNKNWTNQFVKSPCVFHIWQLFAQPQIIIIWQLFVRPQILIIWQSFAETNYPEPVWQDKLARLTVIWISRTGGRQCYLSLAITISSRSPQRRRQRHRLEEVAREKNPVVTRMYDVLCCFELHAKRWFVAKNLLTHSHWSQVVQCH